MTDNLGIFGGRPEEPVTEEVDLEQLRAALQRKAGSDRRGFNSDRPATGRRAARARALAIRRRKRRTLITVMLSTTVLAVIVILVTALVMRWRDEASTVPDFAGAGDSDVIVRIERGDTLASIASTLVAKEVVAGVEAFNTAATGNTALSALTPGYYKVRAHASAGEAIAAITDPNARVGNARMIPGLTLADVTTVRDSTDPADIVPGYISAITAAACVPLNGVSDCFTADELWEVARTADPVSLGVVDWAVADIAEVDDPSRRLEGMIAPGDYDIAPGSDPEAALRTVISGSSAYWNNTGIVDAAEGLGVTPYQALVVASLVEREGIPSDMSKVARVIYNRLDADMILQFDSTVNYGLGHAQLALTRAELDDTTNPYNTYEITGLPPTPIASPGENAVTAMLEPMPGDWLFFVKVDLEGNSCFSVTNDEHEACIAVATENGVFG